MTDRFHAEMGRGLPYLCPEHPTAQVRHSWDRTRTEVNWGPHRPRILLSKTDRNHKYECAKCNRELAAAKEIPDDA